MSDTVLAFVLIWLVQMGAVARVTRFVVLDDLIEAQRDWVMRHLRPQLPEVDADQVLDEEFDWPPRGWQWAVKNKLADLIDCPWCVSIWVAAATLWATYLFTDYTVILPVFWWLSLSMGATFLIDWTDGQRSVKIEQ